MTAPCSIPDPLVPPAFNARILYDANRFEEAVAFCQKESSLLEKQLPAKSVKLPRQDLPDSVPFQYFALACILVNSLIELGRWKSAKEVLGRYRTHFPRDPWGFAIGAVTTRADPEVQDRAAVQRAADLLQMESERLESMAASKRRS